MRSTCEKSQDAHGVLRILILCPFGGYPIPCVQCSQKRARKKEEYSACGDTRSTARGKRLRKLVPEAGIEPARCCHRQILSLLRLPISPLRRRGKAAGNYGTVRP